MRFQYLRNCALSAAFLAVLAAAQAADEVVIQSSTPKSPTAAKPLTGVPTPAKYKPGAVAIPIVVAPKDEPDVASKSKSESTPAQPLANTADEPLRPIPDSLESGPISIEAASFKGVIPGKSTKADVEKAWGQPKKSVKQKGDLVQLYSIGPFNRVEVNYGGDAVSSIVIRFDRVFTADNIAKQLDLATIRPVLVSNELGEVLGLAYPERGVLFGFESNQETAKSSTIVAHLILEPIGAEPFVLRAETTLDSRCDLSLRDLEQAIALEPENARVHWLRSRALLAMGQSDKAAGEATAAVRLEPDNPQYRITSAQMLAQTGRLAEAIDEAQKAVESSQDRPHIKAKALCLVGDLLATGPTADYKKAISFHTQALQLADPLSKDSHPAIRVAAKEVLVDADLGAAGDIALGQWREKEKAVVRWLERALDAAVDLVENEGRSREHVFRVHVRALAAYVGLRGAINPEPTIKELVATGDELIAATPDPVRKAQLQQELGLALCDALQICQVQSDLDGAVKYGRQAGRYLASTNETKQSSASAFQLGRLYFRLGTINSADRHDHQAAIEWFDKAMPLLLRPSPEELAADLGRHGESFVAMGVSYWETGQREKAVELTEKGIDWMEKAVKQGTFDTSRLAIAYNNFAAMQRKLGETDVADRYQEMAQRAKKEKIK